jgi:hypothetical protein
MTEDVGVRESIAITPAKIVDATRKPATQETVSLLEAKERGFNDKVMAVFGSNEDIHGRTWARFEPRFKVNDELSMDILKPTITEAFKSGIEYWTGVKKSEAFSLEAEQNLTVYERALDFLGGSRRSSSSFVEAIDQMSLLASNLAGLQASKRIDDLLEQEAQKGPLYLGKLVYGKLGILWNVGGREIYDYGEDFKNHVTELRAYITSKV